VDPTRFDRLTRLFGGTGSRRSALAALAGLGVATEEAAARCPRSRRCGRTCCPRGKTCCDDERGTCCDDRVDCCNPGRGGTCCARGTRCASPFGSRVGDDWVCCPQRRQWTTSTGGSLLPGGDPGERGDHRRRRPLLPRGEVVRRPLLRGPGPGLRRPGRAEVLRGGAGMRRHVLSRPASLRRPGVEDLLRRGPGDLRHHGQREDLLHEGQLLQAQRRRYLLLPQPDGRTCGQQGDVLRQPVRHRVGVVLLVLGQLRGPDLHHAQPRGVLPIPGVNLKNEGVFSLRVATHPVPSSLPAGADDRGGAAGRRGAGGRHREGAQLAAWPRPGMSRP
jgi:hypothetical protein